MPSARARAAACWRRAPGSRTPSSASSSSEAPAWAGRLAVGSAADLADEIAAGHFLSGLYDSIDKIRVDLGPTPRG